MQVIDRIQDSMPVRLVNTFFVDPVYSKRHAHMIHKHDDVFELLYIADGEGRYDVGGREYAVTAGDLVYCNAGVLHGEGPFQQNTIQTYCLAFRGVQLPDLARGWLMPEGRKPVLTLPEAERPVIAALMVYVYGLFHRSEAEEDRDTCRRLGDDAFRLAKRVLRDHLFEDNPIRAKQERLVLSITDYLNEHYKEELSLKKIASDLYISQTYLSHLFKRETGLSPMQYVIQRRIGEAQTLLCETAVPIGRIEESLGFGSSTHFSIMFKKYVGVSPLEYRKHFLRTEK